MWQYTPVTTPIVVQQQGLRPEVAQAMLQPQNPTVVPTPRKCEAITDLFELDVPQAAAAKDEADCFPAACTLRGEEAASAAAEAAVAEAVAEAEAANTGAASVGVEIVGVDLPLAQANTHSIHLAQTATPLAQAIIGNGKHEGDYPLAYASDSAGGIESSDDSDADGLYNIDDTTSSIAVQMAVRLTSASTGRSAICYNTLACEPSMCATSQVKW